MATSSSAAMPLTIEEQNELREKIAYFIKDKPLGEKSFYQLMPRGSWGPRNWSINPRCLQLGMQLDNGQDIGKPQGSSLGYLDRLPPKVTGLIFQHMDIQTFTTF